MKKKEFSIFLFTLLLICTCTGCSFTPTNNDIDSESKRSGKDIMEVYKTNGFYYIYVDNETGVLYLSNGRGLTTMYNADGTLKTVEQKE